MQRVIMTAAGALLGAGLAVTTVKAELNYGPVVDQAKAMCFHKTPNADNGFFGYWAECPKPATAAGAASRTATAHRRHTKQSEKGGQEVQ